MDIHTKKALKSVAEYASALKIGTDVKLRFEEMIDSTSELPVKHIDFLEREIRWNFSRSYRDTPKPVKILGWPRLQKPSPWIRLCSSSGYDRENAFNQLDGPAPNSLFFAFAIRRLNDWVSVVRDSACQKLIRITEQTEPEIVVPVLCEALTHWNSWGRIRQEQRSSLLSLVGLPKIRLELKEFLIKSTSGPMTSIFSQIGRTNALDSDLREIALSAIQPPVRAKAYRSLFENKMVWLEKRVWEWTDKRYCISRLKPVFSERHLANNTIEKDLYELAASDRSPIVRRVAGEMVIRDLSTLGGLGHKLAESLSKDCSPTVAERGDFALKKLDKATSNQST